MKKLLMIIVLLSAVSLFAQKSLTYRFDDHVESLKEEGAKIIAAETIEVPGLGEETIVFETKLKASYKVMLFADDVLLKKVELSLYKKKRGQWKFISSGRYFSPHKSGRYRIIASSTNRYSILTGVVIYRER